MNELFKLKPSKQYLLLVIFAYSITALVAIIYAPIEWALLVVVMLGVLLFKQVSKLMTFKNKITALRLTQNKITLYYQNGKTTAQTHQKPIFQSRYLIVLPIQYSRVFYGDSLVIFRDSLIAEQDDKNKQFKGDRICALNHLLTIYS